MPLENDVVSDDKTFRLILIVVVAAFVPIALYFRIRSITSEKLDRWQEGRFILFGLRLSGFPTLAGGIAWMINPRWMDWSSIALPVWLRWVDVAVAACSGMLLVWAFGNLGRNLTDTVVTRKVHTLITTGPYRYVRHPFYLAVALGVMGWSLVMANWFILLSGAMVVAFQMARTRIEEKKLVERFGVEYQDYMRRVGRFFPRLKAVS
jgi:protein-S-isoprenylcysteine O-methyltransferase Ste14